MGNSDLLPNANIIPRGKQKIKPKNETMNVKDRPPQALVSTHSKPKDPPDIKKYIIKKAIIGYAIA